MSEFKLNKGYNIRLTGKADKTISDLPLNGKYASKPTDFKFLKPKLDVELNQKVKAGECRCEETNPSGGCCLGSVAKAIKHAVALNEQGLL